MPKFEEYLFGDLLRGFRHREGLTQQELAGLVGRHRNAVVAWESGGLPRGDEIVHNLVEVLNLSTTESARLFEAARFPAPPRPERLPGPGDLVEAESCPVGAPNTWKLWASPEFSGGKCLTNELQGGSFGRAVALSTLYLKFSGTGVTIVYRQDTWYGLLSVEIDGSVVGAIDQQGMIKNQAEEAFSVGSTGLHLLALCASAETGVITVDAIRVL
jgi:transcriptional regulator with XRE-family HTH domain